MIRWNEVTWYSKSGAQTNAVTKGLLTLVNLAGSNCSIDYGIMTNNNHSYTVSIDAGNDCTAFDLKDAYEKTYSQYRSQLLTESPDLISEYNLASK